MDPRPKYDPTAARLRPFPGGRSLDRSNPWIYVASVQGTRKAKARRGALICPTDVDPMAFRWPVDGLGVMVVTDDDKTDQARRLARALIRDGANLVACVAPNWNSYYRQHEVIE